MPKWEPYRLGLFAAADQTGVRGGVMRSSKRSLAQQWCIRGELDENRVDADDFQRRVDGHGRRDVGQRTRQHYFAVA